MIRNLLTPCILVCGIACLSASILYAQQEAAPEGGSNFSLSPNDLGALQNSVNLYTGQVSFPMTVASLPGRGGLSPKITINYNSAGVKNTVERWNRERPTGILGLGWSFEYPRIVANHNNTATRNDDTFYLVEGGQSVRLICREHQENGVTEYRPYATEIYQPWRIRYYPGQEKWEIVKDDGVRYIYGDNNRPEADGTLQNVIAYGNWIGASKQRTGQTELAHAWNLSTIRNLWGDSITYYYENIEEELGDPSTGSSTAKYTRASVLRRVTGPTGNYLQLNYGLKTYDPCTVAGDFRCSDTHREYQDPHVESTEPDAYQEQYEHRYLLGINAFDHNLLPLYDVAFEYDTSQWVGAGEYRKRTLTGIEQTNYTRARLPKTTFEYDTANTDSKGYLTFVGNSIGGKITYQYASSFTTVGEVCNSRRTFCEEFITSGLVKKEIQASAPPRLRSEPNIYMGPNYVVVIWRQKVLRGRQYIYPSGPGPSYLQIYEWQGEWVRHDIGDIGQLRRSTDIDKHELVVALEQDHFGVALRQGNNAYRVNLFHKNKFNGTWHSYTDNVSLVDGQLNNATYLGELFFTAGHDYVALGNIGTERIYTYAWMDGSWEKRTFQHSPAAGYAFTGSSHYLIAHNTKPEPNDFWLHYRSEDKRWVSRDFTPTFTGKGIDTGELKDKSFWYSTPTFAFVMANNNPEFIYDLGEGYMNHTRTSLERLPDYYPVRTPSTSNIYISTHRPEEDFRRRNELFFYRYNGRDWIKKMILGSGRRSNYRGPHLNHPSRDVLGFSLGRSRVSLLYYDANQEDWRVSYFTTRVDWLDRYVKVSPRSALMGEKLYYLEPNGKWLEIGLIDTEGLKDDSWVKDLKSSNDLYVVSKPYDETRFYKIRNGKVTYRELSKNMDKRSGLYDVGDRLLGNGIMAAFSAVNTEKYNASGFSLYKWQEDNFVEGHKVVVVSSVKVNDGVLNISKWYNYNEASARVDPSGNTPLFNEVTVVTGGQSADERPKGYTKHYFHNGKPLVNLSKIPAGQTDDDVLLFAGSHYLTEMYNSQDQLVTSSETVYNTFKQAVFNTAGQAIDRSYFVRPTRSLTQDFLAAGTQSALTVTSYNSHGYPAQVSNYSAGNTSNAQASNQVIYTYYPEGYSAEATQYNLYSEIISTRTFANGEVVSAEATVWTDEGSIPRATRTYGWRGFGSTVFDGWDATTPGSQWRLSNKILERDNKGNILESTDFLGEKESAIYDDLQLNPVLSASYAAYEQVAGTSFEEGQFGKVSITALSTTEAYTGTRSLGHNGEARITLPVGAAVYDVYYWYKDSPGTVTITGDGMGEDEGDQRTARGWTLRKWKVTGSASQTTTLTVRASPTGYIDELRLHPGEAYVTTYVYDERQRKVAETGPGMATTFYYYDDYHRQHYITDHDGHIVLYYEYGFKKLPE